ncbi:hypothetical protein [Nostoc sp.]
MQSTQLKISARAIAILLESDRTSIYPLLRCIGLPVLRQFGTLNFL